MFLDKEGLEFRSSSLPFHTPTPLLTLVRGRIILGSPFAGSCIAPVLWRGHSLPRRFGGHGSHAGEHRPFVEWIRSKRLRLATVRTTENLVRQRAYPPPRYR